MCAADLEKRVAGDVSPAADWQIELNDTLWSLKHEGRKNTRAVLFIHGLTGEYLKTWQSKKTSAYFPKLIFDDAELADYDVFTFSYRTTFLNGTSIEAVAQQLHAAIESRVSSYDQLVLIAHSLGGLVSMRYIVDQVGAGNTIAINGLLLYGVPTIGSHLANIARLGKIPLTFGLGVAGAVVAGSFGYLIGRVIGGSLSWIATSHKQVKQLELGGEFAQKLNAEWALRIVNGGHPKREPDQRATIPVRVIHGTLDKVVPKISSISVYGEIDCWPLDHSHTGLTKPDDRSDLRYDRARMFLKSCRTVADHDTLKKLRKISDGVLKTSSKPVYRDWEYEIMLNEDGVPDNKNELLSAGFSFFQVTNCKLTTVLTKSIRVGFAWDGATTDAFAFDPTPLYVHCIGLEDLNERNIDTSSLSTAIRTVLTKNNEDAWKTLFPDDVTVTFSLGADDPPVKLVAGNFEHRSDSIFRQYEVPQANTQNLGKRVTYNVTFRSYHPKAATSYELTFPDLQVGFNGRITVLGSWKDFNTVQLLKGGEELDCLVHTNAAQSVLRIKTDDIVLPGSSVRINWKPA